MIDNTMLRALTRANICCHRNASNGRIVTRASDCFIIAFSFIVVFALRTRLIYLCSHDYFKFMSPENEKERFGLKPVLEESGKIYQSSRKLISFHGEEQSIFPDKNHSSRRSMTLKGDQSYILRKKSLFMENN